MPYVTRTCVWHTIQDESTRDAPRGGFFDMHVERSDMQEEREFLRFYKYF